MSSGHRMGHDLLAYTLQDGALIPDPGDGLQINVDRNFGICELTIAAGTETRTLPDPSVGTNGIGSGVTLVVVLNQNAGTQCTIEGVTFTTEGQYAVFRVARVNGTKVWVDTGIELEGLTASVAELNTLDGVTATTAELNKLDDSLSTVLMSAGAGVSDADVYAGGAFLNGGLIVTRIMVDLTNLVGSATDLDIIGNTGGAASANFGQITAARNGDIVGGKVTCLEVPTGGADDIDFYSASVATGAQDGLITDLTETVLITSGAAWASGTTKGMTGVPPINSYLYICNGEAAGGTFTAGKFLIELFGVPS